MSVARVGLDNKGRTVTVRFGRSGPISRKSCVLATNISVGKYYDAPICGLLRIFRHRSVFSRCRLQGGRTRQSCLAGTFSFASRYSDRVLECSGQRELVRKLTWPSWGETLGYLESGLLRRRLSRNDHDDCEAKATLCWGRHEVKCELEPSSARGQFI